MIKIASVLGLATLSLAFGQEAVESSWKRGKLEMSSAGALAFGPDGVLFVADPSGASIYAVRTGDTDGDASRVQVTVERIDHQVAALLGTSADDILINDLAVNPASGQTYLSVSRGRGPDAVPVIVRVNAEGELSELALHDGVEFSRVQLTNAPDSADRRTESITDLAYIDGQLLIAGLSNEEFASKLRAVPFPFRSAEAGTSVEIYHGAHGAWETRAPVRTLVPFLIDDDPHLVAAYTCTPLVKFPLSDLGAGEKIRGTTIAELGNRNRPLDMIVYEKEGQVFILIANSSRGMMKVTTDGIGTIEGITSHVSRGGTAGLEYETIDYLEGVVQMDILDNDYIVALIEDREAGGRSLVTVETP